MSLEQVGNGYNSKGYVRNKLCLNTPNDRILFANHHLVRDRFLTPVEGRNMMVHHINGVKWDNRPSNLQIINQELNVAYAIGRLIVARCVRGDGGVVRYVSMASCCRFFNFIQNNFVYR